MIYLLQIDHVVSAEASSGGAAHADVQVLEARQTLKRCLEGGLRRNRHMNYAAFRGADISGRIVPQRCWAKHHRALKMDSLQEHGNLQLLYLNWANSLHQNLLDEVEAGQHIRRVDNRQIVVQSVNRHAALKLI